MPPAITITDLEPPEESRKGKRLVQRLVHIWHLLTALLLLVIVILGLIFGPIYTWFNLHVVPFALYDIIYTFSKLFKKQDGGKQPPMLRRHEFGIFARIRFRAFLYQASAAIALAQSWVTNDVLNILALVVWCSGELMFILGCVANEFDFLDWVQEVEEEGGIQLLASEDDDDAADLLENTVQPAQSARAGRV